MGLPYSFLIMSYTSTDTTQEPQAGRGYTVKRIIGGKEFEIPWGFKDFRSEGKAAKGVGIEYPATSRKA